MSLQGPEWVTLDQLASPSGRDPKAVPNGYPPLKTVYVVYKTVQGTVNHLGPFPKDEAHDHYHRLLALPWVSEIRYEVK